MCKKIITDGSARNIDPCLEDELEQIKTPYFQKKFEIIMSCCGHGKYSKTLIVQNRGSKVHFEWFSGTRLTGTKRVDSREPFYKRDQEGHYYIPEVDEEKTVLGMELEPMVFGIKESERKWDYADHNNRWRK